MIQGEIAKPIGQPQKTIVIYLTEGKERGAVYIRGNGEALWPSLKSSYLAMRYYLEDVSIAYVGENTDT